MGEIRKRLKIMFGGRTTTVNTLIDSGATHNFIKPKFVNKIKSSMWGKAEYYMGDGKKKYVGQHTGFFIIRRNRLKSVDAIATNEIDEDLVLGQKFLQDNHVIINFSNDTFEFGEHAPRVRKIARY